MHSYWIRVGPNSVTGILVKREIWTEIQTQREDNHVKMKAEIEVMLPQAKEHQGF